MVATAVYVRSPVPLFASLRLTRPDAQTSLHPGILLTERRSRRWMSALVHSPGLACPASMADAFTFSASRSTPAARCTRLRIRTQSSSSSPRPLIRINAEGDEIRPVLLFDAHAPRLLVRRRNGSRPRMPRAGPSSRYRAAEPACSCFKPCPTSYFFSRSPSTMYELTRFERMPARRERHSRTSARWRAASLLFR
jgi:hypothetical protein